MLTGCVGAETLCDLLEGRVDPEARKRLEQHASRCAACRELLARIDPSARRRGVWRVWRVWGAALAILVAAALVVLRARSTAREPDAQPCAGAEAVFAAVWNAERRGAIEARFAASGAPYAAAALRQVTAALDQYGARWAQADDEACRAARTLRQETEDDLELRRRCLERARQDASALIDALAQRDPAVVARAPAAVAELPEIAACDDPAALRGNAEPPSDPAARAGIAAMRRRLSELRARLATGAYAGASELGRRLVADARALGHLPLLAEAALAAGLVEDALGNTAEAERLLQGASASAEAGKSDLVAARARTGLVRVVGLGKGEYARALGLAPGATAAIARIGGDLTAEAGLEQALGAIALALRDGDGAVAHFEKLFALEAQRSGSDTVAAASALDELGVAVLVQGHAGRAVRLAQQAVVLREHLLGPEHPDLARPLNHLGNAHVALGDPATGERDARRALALRVRWLGPQHPSLAENLIDLARAIRLQGRSAEALELARRAVAIGQAAPGDERPELADALVELGAELAAELGLGRGKGHAAEADEQLRRAERILAGAFGPDHVRVVPAIVARGDLMMTLARWQDAAALYGRALPVLERSPATRDALATTLASLCRTHVELQDSAHALAALERLAAGLRELSHPTRVAVEFTLARALWDTGGDRARAVELAGQASAEIRTIPGALRGDIARIDHWLASHRQH